MRYRSSACTVTHRAPRRSTRWQGGSRIARTLLRWMCAAAARPLEDEEETARGVLREGTDRRWAWKMDPAYIEQRVNRRAPARPPLWPTLETLPCATQIVWGTDSDVLSEAQAKRMVAALPRGELVSVPGVGHAPTLVEPPVLAALDRLLATV